ncbi:MAG TPA: SPASM domain-containing protein, partial [Candidatus Binatia bacterium]|nr:SPASM domain-containing protein [Candidatus Binatia bacterium]
IGGQYLQFLPLVERHDDSERTLSPRTVPAEAYGEFLCTVFDEWVRNDIGKIFIQLFDESTRPFLGMDHALCIYRETCGDVPVIEHNGDFYSCDHYVEPEYKIGNIYEQTLAEMIEHPAQRDFGQKKWTSLPRYCRECPVLSMCNGGCPKDRFIKTPEGEEGLNFLCAGLKRFFTHSRPYLQKFAELVEAGEPAEALMQLVRAEDAKEFTLQAGRNDPCPCGSGKKYKKCCLIKRLRSV